MDRRDRQIGHDRPPLTVNQPTSARSGGATSLGYQPALDGLRAVSVIAVVLYHAGFHWMHGGFFGVEVFFVISGFLITSLLIEERARFGIERSRPVLDAARDGACCRRSPSCC